VVWILRHFVGHFGHSRYEKGKKCTKMNALILAMITYGSISVVNQIPVLPAKTSMMLPAVQVRRNNHFFMITLMTISGLSIIEMGLSPLFYLQKISSETGRGLRPFRLR